MGHSVRIDHVRGRQVGLLVTEFCEPRIALRHAVDRPLGLTVADEQEMHWRRVPEPRRSNRGCSSLPGSMMFYRVHRSIARHMLFALAAIFLTVAAVDVMWVHGVSGPPEIDEATQTLTTRGLSQQRTDFMWGTFFLVSAGVLGGVAAVGLIARRPVVEMDRDGLRLRVAGPRSYIGIPWSNVRWVHSSADGDDELVPARVLLINVIDASHYPLELWGAQWDDRTVMVDADSWNTTPEEVVTHAQRALDAWRRDHSNEEAVLRESAVPREGEREHGEGPADSPQVSLLDSGIPETDVPG